MSLLVSCFSFFTFFTWSLIVLIFLFLSFLLFVHRSSFSVFSIHSYTVSFNLLGIPAPRTIGKAGRQPSGVKIKLKSFLKFWQNEIEPYDRIERFFRIIKKHDADYIYKDDFVPFLQELLHFHPGLDFLEQHEEFQRKYALTVITRIFYKVNTSRTGKISLHELRRSNLFSACMHVDEETDINRVLDYFSYEHFYVIYCKFFELDTDKDSKLTKSDLMKYGDHALTETIVDR
jgi:serine/threonine-protein phosphatase 2A regulatory subunit B''